MKCEANAMVGLSVGILVHPQHRLSDAVSGRLSRWRRDLDLWKRIADKDDVSKRGMWTRASWGQRAKIHKQTIGCPSDLLDKGYGRA